MLICGHNAAPFGAPACRHVYDPATGTSTPFIKYFTGVQAEYRQLCRPCSGEYEKGEPVEAGQLCLDCFEEMYQECAGWRGSPQVLDRPCPVDGATVRTLVPAQLLPLLDLAPVAGPRTAWLVLTESGGIFRWEPDAGAYTELARTRLVQPPDPKRGALSPRLRLRASRDGRYAAVAVDFGSQGEVLDLVTGEVVMTLDAGGHHPEQTPASVAFLERDGRNLLIHRTGWNRLDVTDLDTRTLLTERTTFAVRDGKPTRFHYSPIFRGRLHVSPGGSRIADDGWVWGSAGIVTTWDLTSWLTCDPYESEDGSSLARLREWEDWNHPMVWLDDHRLALSGLGEGCDPPRYDGVRIFDMRLGVRRHLDHLRGAEVMTFAGPGDGRFFSAHGLLFAADENGLGVWDPQDGARLARVPGFRPTHHHSHAGELVAVVDGALVRWRTADPRQPRGSR